MKNASLTGLAAAALLAVAAPATAVTIGSFDPDGTGTRTNLNGSIGTGISNQNMVIDSAGGITLGLKSIHRFVGDWGAATLDGDRGVYTVSAGLGADTDPANLASNPTAWSYTLAYDLGSANPLDYGLRVRLDFDPADGPVGAGDWYQIDVAGLPSQGGDSQTMGFDWYAAFSDGAAPGFPNVTFSGTANYSDIDVLALGRYDVEVEIYELGTGNVVVATAMNVMVVPLPPAAWAGLAGLAGAAVLRRRVLR
ncbi:MAG: hypothetical protein ACYTEV_10755 [Planctomycetota bacterium]|jgi:hypothetical protein